MRRPRVSLVHYSCAPILGGVELVLEEHARLLNHNGFSVQVIVGRGRPFHRDIPVKRLAALATDNPRVGKVTRQLAAGRVPADFDRLAAAAERALAPLAARSDIFVVHNAMTMHFNLPLTLALARLPARAPDARFVAWVHDLTATNPAYTAHQRRREPWSVLTRPAPGYEYVAISRQRRRELARVLGLPAKKITRIPDGIDARVALNLSPTVYQFCREHGILDAELVIITPARLVRRKNFERGLDLVRALKQLGRSVRWIVTAAPDPHNPENARYFRELLARRRRLGLDRQVLFITDIVGQPMEYDDLRSLYRVSDVMLLPSTQEGFGIPLLEAGLHRALVACSDIPTLKETAGRRAVYLPLKEPSVRAARRLLAARDRSRLLSFRRQVMRRYRWEAVGRDYLLPFFRGWPVAADD